MKMTTILLKLRSDYDRELLELCSGQKMKTYKDGTHTMIVPSKRREDLDWLLTLFGYHKEMPHEGN